MNGRPVAEEIGPVKAARTDCLPVRSTNVGKQFSPDDLRLLNEVEEIEIEIGPAQDPQHRRVIWIVVAGPYAYVRSVNSKAGHWYQEIVERSVGTIYAEDRRIEVHVVPVSDPEIQAQVNDAYARKYAQYPDDVEWLLGPEVLGTTLRLEPVSSEQPRF
jgi:hypothetical protein